MPTIVFPDRDESASPSARDCPHCGRPMKGVHGEVHGFYAIVVTLCMVSGIGFGFVAFGMTESPIASGLAAMLPAGVAFLWISGRHR